MGCDPARQDPLRDSFIRQVPFDKEVHSGATLNRLVAVPELQLRVIERGVVTEEL